MIKLFNRILWHNNTTPAINEDNLNAMSKAIDDIDNRVIELGTDVLEVVPQIQTYLDQAEDLYEAMENLSKHPPYIGANGNWYVWNTETSAFVDSGIDASITVQIADVTMLAYGTAPYITNSGTSTDPVFHLFIPRAAGITSITKTGTSGLVDTYTITFQDGNTATFTVTNGKSIVSIAKTATSGLVDTYTITFNDSTTTTFQVTNGKNGENGQDGDDGVSPSVTITSITGGHRVTITDATHPSGQSFDVMDGSGAGDMTVTVYDPNGTVASAGGITAYVASSAAHINYTNQSMSASNVKEALDELKAAETEMSDQIDDKINTSDIANNLTTTNAGKVLDATQGKILNDDITNKHKITRKTVNTSSWTADSSSQSGSTLYKKTIILSHVYVTSPSVDISSSSGTGLPTLAQQEAYDLLQYVTVNGTTLTLYASAIPTVTFYIQIEGVD